MLKDGLRTCDVCTLPIAENESYSVVAVPKRQAEIAISLFEGDPELTPTYTVAENGTAQLELCVDCKMNMRTGNETVN
jgi:hypothetical protein